VAAFRTLIVESLGLVDASTPAIKCAIDSQTSVSLGHRRALQPISIVEDKRHFNIALDESGPPRIAPNCSDIMALNGGLRMLKILSI
jgi:hypothetical protein